MPCFSPNFSWYPPFQTIFGKHCDTVLYKGPKTAQAAAAAALRPLPFDDLGAKKEAAAAVEAVYGIFPPWSTCCKGNGHAFLGRFHSVLALFVCSVVAVAIILTTHDSS